MAQKYVPGQMIIGFKDSVLGTAPPAQPRPLSRDALLLLANVRTRFGAEYMATLLHVGVPLVPELAAIPGPLTPALTDFVNAALLMPVQTIPDFAGSKTLLPDARKLVRVNLPAGNVRAALDYVRQFPSLVAYAERMPLRFFHPQVGQFEEMPWGNEAIGFNDDVRREWYQKELHNIAVLDSGVDAEHPAMNGQVIPVNQDAAVDRWGHGTAVSSVITAKGAQTIGSASVREGLLPASKVLMFNVGLYNQPVSGVTFPVDFPLYMTVIAELTAQRLGNESIKREGMQFKIRVVNMSFGGLACSITESDVLRQAFDAGLHLVACAGNRDGALDDSTDVWFPAALASVTSVSALGKDAKLWSHAKYTNPYKGSKVAVDLAAPGQHILTAWPANGASLQTNAVAQNYRFSLFVSGSSFAAPYVTAASSVLFDKEEKSQSTGGTGVTGKAIQQKLCGSYSKDLSVTGLGNGVLDVSTLKP
ncbi:MAG: S8 family serine peptidase [Bryobacteraceae bacterium]